MFEHTCGYWVLNSLYHWILKLSQETEQMQRYNQRLVEELKSRQTQERARLPKIQRSEAKTRMAMFKKSLRINSTATPDQDRDKIKQVSKQITVVFF